MARPRVAVIGAGAGGIVAAKTLRDFGLDVAVFERQATVGGIWRRGGDVVYRGLRTNLPHQIMGYRDFPFKAPCSFVTTAEMTEYMEDYYASSDILDIVDFSVEVLSVTKDHGCWTLRSRQDDVCSSAEFDAVVVANGHYDKAAHCAMEGAADFPGTISHSRDYDEPSSYAEKVVVVVGARSSGTDIAKEICFEGGASRVIVVDRACAAREVYAGEPRLVRAPPLARLRSDGGAEFADGTTEAKVDEVIECCGFDYDFPFLAKELLRSHERCVEPLWEQLFHSEDPSLVFLGIPHSIVPFPLMQIQSILAARVFAGQIEMPKEYHAPSEKKERRRDAHHLGNRQWDYSYRLLRYAQLSDEEMEKWRLFIETNRQIYDHISTKRPSFPGSPDTYRSLQYTADHATGAWSCS